MIISNDKSLLLEDFRLLMQNTDRFLNCEAESRQEYFSKRNGTQLEQDVFEAMKHCSLHTPFENTIRLVSGASFPDIVANRFYGVEVKSTIKNHWKTIGSSILESTRNPDVERIFLTFGKLGKPVAFRSRPYEECLSGISVTHYPRYQIDMELKPGDTIFDKMGISYDLLRKMDNPVVPVSKYYKSQLKPGESLWWASDSESGDVSSPPVIRFWSNLSKEEKEKYIIQGYVLFPEIFGAEPTKYHRYALYLTKNCSVISTNIRDHFSAGGKVDIPTSRRIYEKVPAIFGRVNRNADSIRKAIQITDEDVLAENWGIECICENRVEQWCRAVSHNTENFIQTYCMLCDIFDVPYRCC